MSLAVAAALCPLAIVGGDSTLVAAQSVGGVDLRRPLAVAVGWTALTLVVGGTLLAGFASPIQAIRDDVLERPDLAFATGFLVFFAPLVVASLPLFVLTYVADHPVVLGVGALVTLPALLVGGALLLVGGTIGALVVGDRIAGSFATGTPSSGRSLVVGSVVLGASQLVPVVGTLVAIGVATVGTGALVRRRFDPWSGDDERAQLRDEQPRANVTAATSTGSRETAEPDEAAARSSSETESGGTVPERDSSTALAGRADSGSNDQHRPERRWSDGDLASDGRDRPDDGWTVDDWEWDIDTDGECDEDDRASETDR
ncbi:ABC transporter permease [Natronorubrum sp. DTA7]|uniref:ABC transporter permease n=1 Tax=Natronorubrum sp. DTA7 TaxID=3447016 RepID=UPI003F87DBAD